MSWNQASALSIRTAEQHSVWEPRGSAIFFVHVAWSYSTPDPNLSVRFVRSMIDRKSGSTHARLAPRPGSLNQICISQSCCFGRRGYSFWVARDRKDLNHEKAHGVVRYTVALIRAHGGPLATCCCVFETIHRLRRHFIKKEGCNVVNVFWGAFAEKES